MKKKLSHHWLYPVDQSKTQQAYQASFLTHHHFSRKCPTQLLWVPSLNKEVQSKILQTRGPSDEIKKVGRLKLNP